MTMNSRTFDSGARAWLPQSLCETPFDSALVNSGSNPGAHHYEPFSKLERINQVSQRIEDRKTLRFLSKAYWREYFKIQKGATQ